MDLAEVFDAGAGGFEDPQAEQSEQGDEGEVVDVGRVAAGGEHGLELQVAQAQRGRLRWYVRASNVFGRGVL